MKRRRQSEASSRPDAQRGQPLFEIAAIAKDDAAPTARLGAGDVVRHIVNEQALLGRSAGPLLAVLKKLRFRLAHADLMREDQAIEIRERIGKLPAKVP